MELPEIHPLNFALRYTPPTLVMHYYIGKDTSQEFVHTVNLRIEKSTTADKIVKELINKEAAYFNPKIVPTEQLKRLVQKVIDNKGKKIGNAKLKPSNIGKTQVDNTISKQAQSIPEPKGKKKPEVPSLAGKLPGFSDSPQDPKPIGKQVEDEMEEDDMIREAVDADGKTIKLQKVMIEGMNKELLMDEHGNLYDMEGNHLGSLDEGIEEAEFGDKPADNKMDLPEIPPYKPKGNKRSHSP